MTELVSPHTTHAEAPSEGVALHQSSSTKSCSQKSSATEGRDVEEAVELLHAATRAVSSLGTCADASGAYLAEAWNVAGQQTEESSSPVSGGEADAIALQELQKLAEADLSDVEKRVAETETTIRNLKNKILLNSQTIERLVAYRLLV